MIHESSLILSGIVLSLASGIIGLIFGRRSFAGQWLTTCVAVLGNGCGLIGAWHASNSLVPILSWPSPLPQAPFELAIDPLSAFFLVPVFGISLLGAVYGLSYWKQTEHPDTGRRLRFFYGLLTAALAILILARNSVTFLFGWEIMAVSAFFLVATDHREAEVREAAWLYLAASHAATLSLFALFAFMYGTTGSYDLKPLAAGSISPTATTIMFLLALIGFGLKAGIMPLHFWLPSAHAMAPSHVSALMSGVLIKAGIYGLVRFTSLVPQPPVWWGGLLLTFGMISAVLGVAFALGQHDLKRLLAYHSIENIGIIVVGLALALLGRSLDQPVWLALGLTGCLLHVWNHAIFKSLLFLCAGSVIHARHTREIDHLGGLAKSMPWTAGCFLIGATAICGLPPLNGFVSEFLIYSGLFHTLGLGNGMAYPAASLAVPALALMGALAVACFVKVYGVVFLGVSRQPYLHPARESNWTMLVPLCTLSACCIAIGLLPTLVAPHLDRALAVWTNRPYVVSGELERLVPLMQLTIASVVLWVAMILGTLLLNWRIRSQPLQWAETWGCGYAAPTPRMQYTASSFAQFLVALLSWSLRPSIERPQLMGIFPTSARFSSHVPEVVLDRAVLPTFRLLGGIFFWFRVMQQGSVQIYLLYILAVLVMLLLFGR